MLSISLGVPRADCNVNSPPCEWRVGWGLTHRLDSAALRHSKRSPGRLLWEAEAGKGKRWDRWLFHSPLRWTWRIGSHRLHPSPWPGRHRSSPSSPSCCPGGWPSLSDRTGQRKDREDIHTHCCLSHHLMMGNNNRCLVAWHWVRLFIGIIFTYWWMRVF